MNVADFVVGRLLEWNVKRCYGYPGDGINGIMGALQRSKDGPGFIQVRHEESAGFMACAESKFTDEPGVCIATAGPGAMHLLTGLYDARMDHQAVVAIIGQKSRHSVGTSFQQESDLHSMLKDVSSEYLVTVNVPEQAPHAIDRAMRIAMDRRTVTTVIIPSDVQSLAMPDTSKARHEGSRSGVGYARPRMMPGESDLQKAADILNQSAKPAILIGSGARGAADEVTRLADKLNAGVAKALLGKDVLPDDLPWVTGCIGLLGTEASDFMVRNCDAILMIGTTFPYTDFLPATGQAKAVQVDSQAKSLSINYPADVNLSGDAESTLQALLPMISEKEDSGWRDELESRTADWWKKLESRAFKDADPINPQRVFWEVSQSLPDKAVLCADSGTSTSWFARDIRLRKGMRASLSGKLSSMGAALPYAIAAKFACPDRTSVAFVGDGAMQMLGLSNLVTIAKYWRTWESPQLVVVILNNRELAHVTWEMRVMEGNPKFSASQDIPDIRYADFAKSLGLAGARIERPEYIPETIQEAFSANVPYVIDAVTDPNVPNLPPHISFSQAKNFAQSALGGDPDAGSLVKQTARDAFPKLFQ